MATRTDDEVTYSEAVDAARDAARAERRQDGGQAATVPMDELARRMRDQWSRLTGPPIPVDFTYDRNGLRLGIAALEDEIREVYDEWAAGKKRLDDPAVAERLASELLDVASVAMLIYRNIPSSRRRTAPNDD